MNQFQVEVDDNIQKRCLVEKRALLRVACDGFKRLFPMLILLCCLCSSSCQKKQAPDIQVSIKTRHALSIDHSGPVLFYTILEYQRHAIFWEFEKAVLERVDKKGKFLETVGLFKTKKGMSSGRYRFEDYFPIQPVKGGSQFFRSVVTIGGQTFYSKVWEMEFTCFPLHKRYDLHRSFDRISLSKGEIILPDVIIVKIKRGVSDKRIQKILDKFGAEILHYHYPQGREYMVWIPQPWTKKRMQRILKKFRALPEVKNVRPVKPLSDLDG